jgi:hypothetical protein
MIAGAAAALLLSLLSPDAGDGDRSSAVTLENTLGRASSAYLRSAATSPVAWQSWGPEAFRLARELDRPVLLSIGAGWCHWCHVMDREAYADAGIAGLINERFVPVKVDRDERPDIDARYQQVARTAFDAGGWPLTLMLTPDGKAFTAGSTFLADERDGLPGLRQFLPRVAALYRERKQELLSSAEAAHALPSIPDLSARVGRSPASMADDVLASALAQFDPFHAGFGQSPKHPPVTLLTLALRRYAETGEPRLAEVITRTLTAMARGAIRDHLAGGFFRYTSDPAWREPHFEKLDHIQAQLLVAYVQAYQMTGDALYRTVAEELLAYIRRVLARPDGGFRGHQDADGRGGDAGHYLWSRAEVEQALCPAEAELLVRHFGLTAAGGRRAPAVEVTADAVARETKMSIETVEARLASGKARLREARERRGEPAVDDTVYADRNGLMVSAYLEAYRVLGDETLLQFALRTLEFLGARLRQPDGGLAHAYASGRITTRGFLADQIAVAAGFLDAFEVRGDARYLDAARDLVRYALRHFWDRAGGGFFDSVPAGGDPAGMRVGLKPFLDDDLPAANALAAVTLVRLHGATNDPEYLRLARETLAALDGSASRLGPLVATYAYAADLYSRGSVHAVIVGRRDDARTRFLWREALAAFRPGKTVIVYDPARTDPGEVPPPAAAMLARATVDQAPRVYVCTASLCSLPTWEAARARSLIETFGRQ